MNTRSRWEIRRQKTQRKMTILRSGLRRHQIPQEVGKETLGKREKKKSEVVEGGCDRCWVGKLS